MSRRKGNKPAAAKRSASKGAPQRPQRPLGLPAWLTALEDGPASRFLLPGLLLIAALVHVTALGTYFAQDDVTFLARARDISSTPWSLARPLSEGFTWRALNALFGLEPLPYRIFNFALHLGSTAFVFLIGARMLRSRLAGAAAAILFGASSIAFTPLHWTSSLVELMTCFFTLAAFHVHLVGRDRKANTLLWLSAILGLAALVSKENAILFPLVLLVANLRLGDKSVRAVVPQAVVTVAYGVAFLATLRFVHYIDSDVYSMTAAPAFVANNFATYLAWSVSLHEPLRDFVAAMNPSAWQVGLPVAIVLVVALWAQRNAERHPEEVGMMWFLAFMAPVVALQYHTYLYYMYLPWPGLCWLAVAAGQRLIRKRPTLAYAAAALLVLFVVAEAWSVRARERILNGPFPADKTVRESMLLKNVLGDLRAANLVAGDQIAFVNPAPRRHVSAVDTEAAEPAAVASYIPLAGTMRQGETIDLFFPGVHYLGFSDTLPRAWENAEVFLYEDDGHARHLGSRGKALAELGTFAVRAREWSLAERMFLRSRALGDTVADATFGLIIATDFTGKRARARAYAREFLARWPDHENAAVVRSALQGPAPPTGAPPAAPGVLTPPTRKPLPDR